MESLTLHDWLILFIAVYVVLLVAFVVWLVVRG